jgi:hypothetical protein
MVGFYNCSTKCGGIVGGKLPTGHGYEFFRISKAVTGAMNGDKGMAIFYIF